MRCFNRFPGYFVYTLALVFFLTFNVYPAGLIPVSRQCERSVFCLKNESSCEFNSRHIRPWLPISIANNKFKFFQFHHEYSSAGIDTVETFEIEFEEESERKGSWKELAAFLIVTGIVAYVVIVMMQPDEEEEKDELPAGGKGEPVPFAAFKISF